MPVRHRFATAATKCLAHCGILRAESLVLPLLLLPVSSSISTLSVTHHRQQLRAHGRRLCCTTSGVGSEMEAPSAAAGGETGNMQGHSVLRQEVRTAVDSLEWPPLVPRRWRPTPALATTPCPPGRVGGGGDDDGGVETSGVGAGAGGGAEKRLKLLSWNVLCDGLSGAHPTWGDFLRAPLGSLDWEKRRWKILEEILRWDCDVLVLQEVDHHHDWLSPMLAKEGYRSLFVKKPIAPGMAFNPNLEDGCSLFYRVSPNPAGDGAGGGVGRAAAAAAAAAADAGQGFGERDSGSARKATTLDLLDAHTFTFAVVEEDDVPTEEGGVRGDSGGDGEGCDPAGPAEAVTSNQVAAIALLGVTSAGGGDGDDGGALVIVATTHLKATKNGRGEMIRARQAKQLLDEVSRFRAGHELARGLPSGSIPLIVAGDFNATPHESEGYEPLCYRQVTAHPLALRSALPVSEGFFTTWKIRPARPPAAKGATRESKHCIDYVWVSGGVRPERRSTLPSSEELGPARAPSFVYPSDHFAIAVDLRLFS
ncbi:unnamed protein product [Scytosiphon promiscuus]